jgi:hypothetical protein
MNEALVKLHTSLNARMRPEDVAATILHALGDKLSEKEKQVLRGAARYADRWSYMSDDFPVPIGGERQLVAVATLFGMKDFTREANSNDPEELKFSAETFGYGIGFKPAHADYKHHRLNKEQREAAGIEDSKRQYNRRFRALSRLAKKAEKLQVEQAKRRLLLVGSSGFAHEITLEEFLADPDAACFVAYYSARRKSRREFSLSGKENPYDEIADMLLSRLTPENDLWMVAQVYQRPFVLAHLGDDLLGELLGKFTSTMREAATILEGVWNVSNFNREKMIVRRGNDSSTWNVIASAYNTARAGWLQCLSAMGATELLDAMCPGKVMRLMAADLAWWHTRSGSDLDPDTKMWANLPLPWEVLRGEVSCSREYVEVVGRSQGVDVQKKGWVGPRADSTMVSTFRPTPELVHGVAIADPTWAAALRKLKVFSGKGTDSLEALQARQAAQEAGVVVGDLPDWSSLPDVRVDTAEGT